MLAGDILRRYSVEMRFGATCARGTGLCSSMTFWPHLGADLGFLQDAGYAVIRFALCGGGEVTADGDPDFLGPARSAGRCADAHRHADVRGAE